MRNPEHPPQQRKARADWNHACQNPLKGDAFHTPLFYPTGGPFSRRDFRRRWVRFIPRQAIGYLLQWRMNGNSSRGIVGAIMVSRVIFPILFVAALASVAVKSCFATVLSDNFSAPASFGGDTVYGSQWCAIPFGTGGSSYNSLTVTLEMYESKAIGPATLSLYTDAGQKPGVLLGDFLSPSSFSTQSNVRAQATFFEAGISLQPSSIYWLVLKGAPASSSAVYWYWSTTEDGTGTGFIAANARTFDAGATWNYFPIAPDRARVVASVMPSQMTPGDFNFDGRIDATDLSAMTIALSDLNAYMQKSSVTASQLLTIADLDGNQVVTNSDYQMLLNKLKSGGGSTSAVPEPTTVFLLAVGFLILAISNRRVAQTQPLCPARRGDKRALTKPSPLLECQAHKKGLLSLARPRCVAASYLGYHFRSI